MKVYVTTEGQQLIGDFPDVNDPEFDTRFQIAMKTAKPYDGKLEDAEPDTLYPLPSE